MRDWWGYVMNNQTGQVDMNKEIDQEEDFEQSGQVKRETTDSFPCPGCGANMKYNPDTHTLTCEYCSNSIEVDKQDGDIEEYDFFTADDSADGDWGQEKRIMECKNCGARTVLDEYSIAQFCAFCGSSHVLKNDESVGIPPESLIPFGISSE